MKNNRSTIKYSLVACIAFSLNISANEHKEPLNDYAFSTQELSSLSEANLIIISDDQFVFNNELALLDWDNVFASYFPHLQPYQETIMHYAGYYSINPKLLISLIESESSLVTEPSDKGYSSPFGTLSKKKGFKLQIKDVASKLSKRFYAYKKLSLQPQKDSYVLRNYPMSSSAASIAIASVLSVTEESKVTDKNKQFRGVKERALVPKQDAKPAKKTKIINILDAYEHIFATSSEVLKQSDKSALMSSQSMKAKAPQQGAVQALATTPNLYLPWTSGWSWRSGGAHGYDGGSWPLSSLDFYYPGGNTGWGGNKPAVYASHGGTVTWYSRCNMRITHASGLATNYYHMDNLQYGSGSYINAGTYIGTYANTKSASLCEGGQSTGPHLHISLLKNGYYESLQGYNFSGFYINVGTSQYDSNCSRSYFWKAGTTYCNGTNIYKPYE